jgi:hypothetical protein
LSFMNDKASATVYALLIILPILLLMGMLLDMIRYQAADTLSEKAVKTAARSVLSAYDRQLRMEYGLFGLAASEQARSEIAEQIVKGISASEAKSKAIAGTTQWASIMPLVQEVTVDSVYTLADHRFLRHQIMEEMKVKAPIEFTRNVFSKWKDMAPELEQASDQFQLSEETERLLERREKLLREAFSKLESMRALMDEGSSILSRPRPAPIVLIADPESPPPPPPSPPPSPYLDGLSTFAQLQTQLDQLRLKLDEVEHIEQQIEEVIRTHADSADLFKNIYILGYSYYANYELGVSRPIAMFGASVQAAIASSSGPNDFSFYAAFTSNMAQKRAEENARRAEFDDISAKKREQRKKTEEQVKQVRDDLLAQVCGMEEERQYTQLIDHFNAYLTYNTELSNAQDDPSPTASLEQSPDDLQRSTLSGMKSLSSILRDIRDEAYINEYVLLYFNNRITSKLKQPLLIDVTSHVLKDQEAEYILYGLPTCTGNRAAAYAELFTVRFAVRTIEALTDVRKTAGSPLLMLLTAAAEGAAKAYQDMNKLLQGEEMPVFVKFPAMKMGYSDYMRLFMALHSKEVNKMARIQALIQLNTGSNLFERPVYVQVRSASSLRMWMMPAVSSLLLSNGEGDGRLLTIDKLAAMAY